MLEVVQRHLLPWAQERSQHVAGEGETHDHLIKHLLLLQPPLRLSPDIKVVERIVDASQMRRGKPTPSHGSFMSHVLWPHLGLHSMPFAWLGFLFQGEADLRIGASRSLVCGPKGEGKIHIVSLHAPAFFVIPPGVPHPDGSQIPWERPLHELRENQQMFWMHLSPAGLRCHLSRVVGQHYQEEFFLLLKEASLAAIARLLISEMQRPQRFDLVVEAALLSLLLQLEKTLNEGSASPNHAEQHNNEPSHNELLQSAALRFIETHLNWRPLSLEMVAEQVHVSPSHLNRVFKAELGVTVKEYIQHSRIELAKSLLEESDMPVAEVGFLLGFFPPSHFARAFSQTVGLSPRKYRDARCVKTAKTSGLIEETTTFDDDVAETGKAIHKARNR
jgi:AraC-like DNA-binding protein